MLTYTGFYQKTKVTVMGHGMGMASIGIYSYELFAFYNVALIIRMGTCGSYCDKIKVGDLLLTTAAYSNSPYAQELGVITNNNLLFADATINAEIKAVALKTKIPLKEVKVYSSDVFYHPQSYLVLKQKSQADVVEMEAFALFANASKLQKKAAVILTCSDSLVTQQSMNHKQRQMKMTKMATLGLEYAKYYAR